MKVSKPSVSLLGYLLFSLVFALSLFLFSYVSHIRQERPSSVSIPAEELPVIVIDAGHGGEDGGAVGEDGTVEKDLNLDIAEDLADLLRLAGFRVVMTRSEDILLYDRNVDYHGRKKALDLSARLQIAEREENAVFVSIHMNAFPQTKYHGMQIYYSPNDPASLPLAESLRQSSLLRLDPQNQRKCKAAGSSIYLLHNLKIPAVLVECGFLSNPQECARLSTPQYRREIALALFCGISNYFSQRES